MWLQILYKENIERNDIRKGSERDEEYQIHTSVA